MESRKTIDTAVLDYLQLAIEKLPNKSLKDKFNSTSGSTGRLFNKELFADDPDIQRIIIQIDDALIQILPDYIKAFNQYTPSFSQEGFVSLNNFVNQFFKDIESNPEWNKLLENQNPDSSEQKILRDLIAGAFMFKLNNIWSARVSSNIAAKEAEKDELKKKGVSDDKIEKELNNSKSPWNMATEKAMVENYFENRKKMPIVNSIVLGMWNKAELAKPIRDRAINFLGGSFTNVTFKVKNDKGDASHVTGEVVMNITKGTPPFRAVVDAINKIRSNADFQLLGEEGNLLLGEKFPKLIDEVIYGENGNKELGILKVKDIIGTLRELAVGIMYTQLVDKLTQKEDKKAREKAEKLVDNRIQELSKASPNAINTFRILFDELNPNHRPKKLQRANSHKRGMNESMRSFESPEIKTKNPLFGSPELKQKKQTKHKRSKSNEGGKTMRPWKAETGKTKEERLKDWMNENQSQKEKFESFFKQKIESQQPSNKDTKQETNKPGNK